MATIKDKCSVLKVPSEATEPMRPAAIGERIGKTAFDTGQLLRDLRAHHHADTPPTAGL